MPEAKGKRSLWRLSPWDPTFIFAAVSFLLPPIKSGNPAAIFQYAVEPCFWAGLAGTVAVVMYSRGGKQQARLEDWEVRAATWYLLNGFVFHYLFDFCVPIFGAVPVMRDAYQQMDTRYGCLPQYACEGRTGVHKAPDPFVFAIANVEGFVHTPLCMLCFVAVLRGWHARRPLEIITATVQILGTLVFQAPELYKNLQHVPPPPHNIGGERGLLENLALSPMGVGGWARFESQVVNFWFAFVVAGGAWYVVPARLAWTAFEGIVASEAEAARRRGGGGG